jgi:ATP-dependent DNA helicase PIF1
VIGRHPTLPSIELAGENAQVKRGRRFAKPVDRLEKRPAAAAKETIVLPPDLEITDEMNRVMDFIRMGKNLFITGKAGSGKSTLLTYLRSTVFPEETIYCSYTGVAALNIGGETLHKFFGFLPDVTIEKVKGPDYHPRSQRAMKVLKTLVIDEISMVRADLLDIIDAALRRYGPNPRKSFGGVQLIMFGDLYQLPPIVKEDERPFFNDYYRSEFFFDSHVFNDTSYELIELTKVYRQKDQHLIEILDRIRTNDVTEDELQLLNSRLEPEFEPPEDEFFITLTATRSLSAQINTTRLEKLPGESHTHLASIWGEFSEKSYPAERILEFKVGAQIMLLNNDQGQRWANGTLARVKDVHSDKNGKVRSISIELASDGSEQVVEPNQWDLLKTKYEGGKLSYEIVGSFIQFPIQLAWSVTIHKAQGKSFDQVILDFSHRVFAPGQMYVALSRCRSLEGMKLKTPVQIEEVMVDQRVVEYMEN